MLTYFVIPDTSSCKAIITALSLFFLFHRSRYIFWEKYWYCSIRVYNLLHAVFAPCGTDYFWLLFLETCPYFSSHRIISLLLVRHGILCTFLVPISATNCVQARCPVMPHVLQASNFVCVQIKSKLRMTSKFWGQLVLRWDKYPSDVHTLSWPLNEHWICLSILPVFCLSSKRCLKIRSPGRTRKPRQHDDILLIRIITGFISLKRIVFIPCPYKTPRPRHLFAKPFYRRSPSRENLCNAVSDRGPDGDWRFFSSWEEGNKRGLGNQCPAQVLRFPALLIPHLICKWRQRCPADLGPSPLARPSSASTR